MVMKRKWLTWMISEDSPTYYATTHMHTSPLLTFVFLCTDNTSSSYSTLVTYLNKHPIDQGYKSNPRDVMNH